MTQSDSERLVLFQASSVLAQILPEQTRIATATTLASIAKLSEIASQTPIETPIRSISHAPQDTIPESVSKTIEDYVIILL